MPPCVKFEGQFIARGHPEPVPYLRRRRSVGQSQIGPGEYPTRELFPGANLEFHAVLSSDSRSKSVRDDSIIRRQRHRSFDGFYSRLGWGTYESRLKSLPRAIDRIDQIADGDGISLEVRSQTFNRSSRACPLGSHGSLFL